VFYLFIGAGKKFILFCVVVFYHFGKCKVGKKKGLLEKKNKFQLNWQMAREVSRMKKV